MLNTEPGSHALEAAFVRVSRLPLPVVGVRCADNYHDAYSDDPYVDCPYDDEYTDNSED